MWLIIVAPILIIICFITRSYWLWGRGLLGSDGWYHFLYVKSIRDNRFRYPGNIDRFLIDCPYRHPPLFHYLLALISERSLLRVYKFIPSLIETTNFALLMIFILWFSHNMGFSEFELILALVISGAVFMTATASWDQSAPINPRGLGSLLYSIILLALFWFLYTENLFGIIFIGLALSAILLSHRLTMQAALFFLVSVIVYTVLWGFPIIIIMGLIVSLGLGFVLAIALSRGFYIEVLKHHMATIDFFKENVKLGLTKKRYPNGSISAVKHIIRNIPMNVWMIPVLLLTPFLFLDGSATDVFLLCCWVIIGAFFFISFEGLSHLGGEIRYLMFLSFPAAVYIVMCAEELDFDPVFLMILMIVAGGGVVHIRNRVAYWNAIPNFSPGRDLMELMCFLKHQKAKNVLSYPSKYNAYIALFGEKNVLGLIGHKNRDYYGGYQISLQKMIIDYNIDLIVLEKGIPGVQEELCGKAKRIFENDGFTVFKVM